MKKLFIKMLSKLPLRNIILFESYPDFDDNTASLYLYLLHHGFGEKYKFVWTVHGTNRVQDERFRDAGGGIKINSPKIFDRLKLLYYNYSAKYLISCNIAMTAMRSGQIAINLTHGWEFKNVKKLGLDYSSLDYILSQGKFWIKLIGEQTNTAEKKILPLGYPRNDLLFQNRKVEEFAKYHKVIIWMPTYRQHQAKDHYEQTPFSFGIPIIQSEEELIELNKLLAEYNILLLLRLHFAQNKSLVQQVAFSNIQFANEDFLQEHQLLRYELLQNTDALITDYSSVYFDYLLLNRPIGITLDDYEWGVQHQRYSVENPLDYTKGEYLYNFDGLKAFIRNVRDGLDLYYRERSAIKKLVIDYNDGKASERIVKFFDF